MRAPFFLLVVVVLGLTSCMDEERLITPVDLYAQRGVFVVNEGNYQYGNASLSFYNSDTREVTNNIFLSANGIPLGDVAQSMAIRQGKIYVVINNSGVVRVLNSNTLALEKSIEGLTSPRHILFENDERAYVSDLYARGIHIVNPSTGKKTGFIQAGTKSMPFHQHPTENLVRIGDRLYTNCWSYDRKVLVIDPMAEKVVDSIEVGLQPLWMIADREGKLWTITDGGFVGNPAGNEKPKLMRINPASNSMEKEFIFDDINAQVGHITLSATGDSILFISNDIYKMSVDATSLPTEPFIPKKRRTYRAIAVDPRTYEVYVTDATDFINSGYLFRFTPNGDVIDSVKVGVTPAGISFF
ncbi:MAG: YncE family protein [Bacteroidales bacterium]|nr:YncE family protein [Bacteroidales bacterium]MBN2747998.1 YncE family protein [Bacteroidales bacterium]